VREDWTTGAVGDHGSPVVPLGIRLDLDDDRLRLRPALGLIVNQQERPLRLAGLLGPELAKLS
jgi:hypothetical protein